MILLYLLMYLNLSQPAIVRHISEPGKGKGLLFGVRPTSRYKIIEANERTHRKTCTTPACIQAANNIKKNMDECVNPCDDFYHFACGNYIKKATIPNDKPFISSLESLTDDIQHKLSELIKKLDQTKVIRPFVILKQTYDQCLNIQNNEMANLELLLKILKKLGNWPVLVGTNWKEKEFEWTKAIYQLGKFGFKTNILLAVVVDSDPKNTSRQIIALNQPKLEISKKVFQNDNRTIQAYYDYMIKIAVKLGSNEDVARKELRKSLEFEKNLSKISLSIEEWWNATALYNPATIEELQQKHPLIPFQEYIQNVLDLPGININKNEVIIVRVPSYLEKLEKLLKTTEKRVLANYIIWRVVSSSARMLTEEFRNATRIFDNSFSGSPNFQSRTQECLDEVSQKIDFIVGALYVRNYFDIRSKNIVEQIVDSLLIQFKDTLKKLRWPDEETRRNAIEKASFMSKHIGYSEELLDDTILEQYYSSLKVSSESYLQTMLNIEKFDSKTEHEQLRKPANKSNWSQKLAPFYVNAMYLPTRNEIGVPAGILQNVTFNANRPQYLNYGAIGYIVGHEIAHAFDNFGKRLDKYGNLKDWWTTYTNEQYDRQIQCFIEQYGKYEILELKMRVNSKGTLNENIADNGGIKQAYLAYKEYVKQNGDEPLLKGLNYTQTQLFWISAANILCYKYRNQYLRINALENQHTHAGFRIIGTVSNTGYFARDFNCPSGSNMNPVKKCSIW